MASKLWRTAFLAVALVATFARAQDDAAGDEIEDVGEDALSAEQLRGIHSKFDLNKDGKASLEEVLKYAQGIRTEIATKDIGMILEEMDPDKDGKLSLEELLKDMEMQADGDEEEMKEMKNRMDLETKKFYAADKNKDNMLDQSELPALFYPETHDGVLELTALATMKAKDADGNSKLTQKEFWEGDLQMEGGDSGSSISDEEKQDFAKLDKDGDGSLNLEELKVWESGRFHTEQALKQLFELGDKDKDGHLSSAELEQAREAIAGSDAQYHLMEWAEHSEL